MTSVHFLAETTINTQEKAKGESIGRFFIRRNELIRISSFKMNRDSIRIVIRERTTGTHDLTVANEALGEGDDRFDPVTQLDVTQVMQQAAQLYANTL